MGIEGEGEVKVLSKIRSFEAHKILDLFIMSNKTQKT